MRYINFHMSCSKCAKWWYYSCILFWWWYLQYGWQFSVWLFQKTKVFSEDKVHSKKRFFHFVFQLIQELATKKTSIGSKNDVQKQFTWILIFITNLDETSDHSNMLFNIWNIFVQTGSFGFWYVHVKCIYLPYDVFQLNQLNQNILMLP